MSGRSTGYSGTPLIRKLGIKPGMACAFHDPPDNYFDLLAGLPDDLTIGGAGESPLDFIHVFVRRRADVDAELPTLRGRIAPNGMIWVSWPKKSSGVPTDLTGNSVRQCGLAAGLVDVKVCAIDATWSGLKFVIRLVDRR